LDKVHLLETAKKVELVEHRHSHHLVLCLFIEHYAELCGLLLTHSTGDGRDIYWKSKRQYREFFPVLWIVLTKKETFLKKC